MQIQQGMQDPIDQLVRKVGDHHVVVRLYSQKISIWAYKDDHRLQCDLTLPQMLEYFSFFDYLKDFFHFFKQKKDEDLCIQQKSLQVKLQMDGIIKKKPIPMNFKKIAREKVVKIALKIASFQFKQLSEKQRTEQLNRQLLEQRLIKQRQSRAALSKRLRTIQHSIQQSRKRLEKQAQSKQKDCHALFQLQTASNYLQKMLPIQSKLSSKSVL